MEYVKIPNIYKREEYGNNKLIEGEYATPELEYLANIPWVWTEKVDGTNIRVQWDGHSVTFGGRTDKAQIPAHLVNKLNELFGRGDFLDDGFLHLYMYGSLASFVNTKKTIKI